MNLLFHASAADAEKGRRSQPQRVADQKIGGEAGCDRYRGRHFRRRAGATENGRDISAETGRNGKRAGKFLRRRAATENGRANSGGDRPQRTTGQEIGKREAESDDGRSEFAGDDVHALERHQIPESGGKTGAESAVIRLRAPQIGYGREESGGERCKTATAGEKLAEGAVIPLRPGKIWRRVLQFGYGRENFGGERRKCLTGR